jgi:hypothetical protein
MILAFVLTAAAASVAQDTDLPAGETRRLVHNYGECIVSRQHKRASQAILDNVSNSELIRRYPRLIDGHCLPRQRGSVLKARFQGDQYRYALADALVRREFSTALAPDFESVPRLYHRGAGLAPSRTGPNGEPLKEAEYRKLVEDFERDQAFTYVSRFGECVVRTNPAGSRALLLTDPDTPDETARFAALQIAFGTCVPEGRSLSFGKLALRGTIAVNYYRLATAATAAQRGSAQ